MSDTTLLFLKEASRKREFQVMISLAVAGHSVDCLCSMLAVNSEVPEAALGYGSSLLRQHEV
jgi:hypothetical protein